MSALRQLSGHDVRCPFGMAWARFPGPTAFKHQLDVRALRPRERETLQETVDRGNRIRVKRRECKQLEAKLKRETQFNRKVEINGELRRCQMALAALESVETSIVRD